MSARDGEFKAPIAPLRSKSYTNIVGRPLTDQRIAFYEARGWYSAEFKQARREFQQSRRNKALKRTGNFIEMADGRMVFNPL